MSYDMFSRVAAGMYSDSNRNPRFTIGLENGAWRLYEQTYAELKDGEDSFSRREPVSSEAIYAADTLRECKSYATNIVYRERAEERRIRQEAEAKRQAERKEELDAEREERLNTQPSHRNTSMAIYAQMTRKQALQMLQELARYAASDEDAIDIRFNTFRCDDNMVEISVGRSSLGGFDSPIIESWVEPRLSRTEALKEQEEAS